jgi:cytochrome P450
MQWRVHRKSLTPAFHFNILHEFLQIFNKNSKILVERLNKDAGKGTGFDIFESVSLCALDIINGMLLSQIHFISRQKFE